MNELKYEVKKTSRFKRDYRQALKQGLDISLLNDIIEKLACGIPLDESNRDHPLQGNWKNHRECHITPDWVLIYHIDDDVLVLTLARTGSHSNLFKE